MRGMSFSQLPLTQGATPAAMAFQVAVALESYEQDLDQFVSAPLEPGLLWVAGNALERVKALAGAQSGLAVPLVDLMISHAQVTQAYSDLQSGRSDGSDCRRLYKQHCHKVESMRRKCLQVVQHD